MMLVTAIPIFGTLAWFWVLGNGLRSLDHRTGRGRYPCPQFTNANEEAQRSEVAGSRWHSIQMKRIHSAPESLFQSRHL